MNDTIPTLNSDTHQPENNPMMSDPIPAAPQKKEHCMTLCNQFPFMWKLCLLYGICYLLFAYRNLDGIGSGIFAAISAFFLLLIAKRLKQHATKEDTAFSIVISGEIIFYLSAAVLISFGNCLTDNGFFLFFNHVGSFLLFSISCIKLFNNDKKWDFGKYTSVLFIWWFQILATIPLPFQDWNLYRKKKDRKISTNTLYVIIGLIIGLPILLFITLLLASADQVFADLLKNIFALDSVMNWLFENLIQNMILLPFGFITYSLLLYLIIGALCRGKIKKEVKTASQFGTPIAVTIFIMIDIVYIIFSGIQFLFLFVKIPNIAYEYSEYAREGFFELLLVALVNFFLVIFCNKHFAKNVPLKASMTVTCVCTFVLIASSAYRMLIYIAVYELTFLRVFVLWFLLLLCFFMAGSILSIYKEGWNTFRYCLFVLTCFYTVFTLSNVDAKIANYNIAQFKQVLEKEHSSTNPVQLNIYLPYEYEHSKAYAPALSDLEKSYETLLGADNLSLLDNYLCVSNHFNYYDNYDYNYYLKKNTAIYDKNISNSIFMWKHFNFVENTCYQICKQRELLKGSTLMP